MARTLTACRFEITLLAWCLGIGTTLGVLVGFWTWDGDA
jgi:hypothetical protein